MWIEYLYQHVLAGGDVRCLNASFGVRVLLTCWSNRWSVYVFWNEAGLVSDDVIQYFRIG